MTDVTAAQTIEDALTVLFTTHHDVVLRTVGRCLRDRDRHLAEDLAQETFLRLWVYLSAGHQVARPAGLLATMARRAVADHYRLARSTRETATDFGDSVQARRLPASPAAEDIAIGRIVAILDLPSVRSVPVAVAA